MNTNNLDNSDGWRRLIRADDLAEGEIRRCPLRSASTATGHTAPADATLPGATVTDTVPTGITGKPAVVLLCRVEGQVHALADTCPHEAISLSLGSLCGHRLRCPLHGSEFDVRTGEVLSEPCEENLQRFEVDLRDNWLYLR